MSRSLPTPPLSSLPFTSIQSLASYPEPLTAFTPKAWFDRARHEADLAIIAERKNKKEEMFIAYTKACQCYANAKLHPDSADVRKSDPVWANRLKDFKETYDAYLAKAKDLKEVLKKREVESPSTAETTSMGSIADRMKALKAGGMDVGPSKRFTTTSGAGSYGVAGAKGRSRASSSGADTTRSRSGSTATIDKKNGHGSPVEDHIRSIPTGSSASSRMTQPEVRSVRPEPSLSVQPEDRVARPDHPHTAAAGPSKPPLPPIPKIQAHVQPAPSPQLPSGISAFEKAFPSLSEFGKQFEEPETNGKMDHEEDVGLPALPSVPTSRPGLPPPPTAFEKPPDARVPSPPNPDPEREVNRPSSQPNLSNLDGKIDGEDTRTEPVAPVQSPPSHSVQSPPAPPAQSSLTFPMPHPTPPTPSHPPQPATKPRFPYTNSINPDTIRTYLLNPAVDLIIIDIRSEEEHRKGYVGQEYEGRAKVQIVWIDPTVLMRSEMNSVKLEDSLSLSPESHRRAFSDRHKVDLVIVYDSASNGWPRKGSAPNPLSRIWDVIFEHEFTKRLERNPVILEGGYHAWREFIKMRVARNSLSRNYKPATRSTDNPPYVKPVPHGHRQAQSMTDYTGRVASPPSYHPTYSPIAPPPQASIHPGPGVRRQSDYVEHHNQSYSGYTNRPIEYPQAHGLSPQIPAPTASHALERYDARPAVLRSGSVRGLDLVANQGDEVRYWNDVVLGLTGLKNFGATCYMNSTIQCLSATYPFTSFFLDGTYKKAINIYNKLGTQGNLANAFSELLKALWKEDYTFLSPVTFRKSITTFAPSFSATSEQHDSQEFLSFVLDGLHEDLNRIKHKPPPVEMTPEREAALETLPPEVASEKEWQIYKARNDSFIVDLFQGQYRNRLECLTCHKTSTTYDTFMYISLPIPAGRPKIVLQELIDEFIATEYLDGADMWNCPRCKVPRRAAKTLTISRLPPVVIIQLKRFTTQNGMFWDKSEAHVVFPMKSLDLTRYVPPRRPTGKEDMDDPRTQIGPFKYDLYGVSNHLGTLSSGHYTAFVKSAKGWQFAEDSRISPAQEKDIVSRQAYMLFYKRVRA